MAEQQQSMAEQVADDLEGLKREWIWFLLLGLALVILGMVAIGSAFITTVATVIVVGIVLMAAGMAQVVTAFWSPKWSGLFLQLLFGLLYIVVGFMLADDPIGGARGLTLLMAVFLIVGGVFRIAAALSMRFRNWGWYLLNGAVSLILGIIIWRNLLVVDTEGAPIYLWLIGIFVGIEIIFCGWSWVMFALGVKNLPAPAEGRG